MREYRDIDLIEEEYDVLKSLEHKLNSQFKIHDFSDDTEVIYSDSKFYAIEGNITYLRIIDINENIKDFPMEILALNKLKTLFLQMPIKSFPKEIFDLPSLKELSFEVCEINQFLPILNKNNSLEILMINSANLRKLPESIKNLHSLHTLILDKCQLRELPKSIGDLRELRDLSLHGNKLKSLPNSLTNLKNLTSLTLDGNRLSMESEIVKELERNGVKISF